MAVVIEDLDIPQTCGECKFIGYYEDGLWSRNPHYCCELMYNLYDEDYKVDKNSMDENCPLKSGNSESVK